MGLAPGRRAYANPRSPGSTEGVFVVLKKARLAVAGLAVAALALVGAVTLSSVASATHVNPVLTAGNPSCAGGVKIEPVASGTYNTSLGTITLVVNSGAKTFDFTSSFFVSKVVVKGGPDANTYNYDPAVKSDTGLHSPNNNGKFYGLSHLCFFPGEAPPPPPPPTTTTQTK